MACSAAAGAGIACQLGVFNDACAAAANVAGCAEECCAPEVTWKWIFVTETALFGNFGGLAAADETCQTEANGAGLGGTYKAWLSDGTTSAASRLTHWTGQYWLHDAEATTVADNWADLTDGTLDAPIDSTPSGQPPTTQRVWTGTLSSGLGSGEDCSSWMSTTGTGRIGNATATDNTWSDDSSLSCTPALDTFAGLYCIKQ